MPRKRRVTRNIVSTIAVCDIVQKDEKKFFTKEVIVSGTFDVMRKLEKAVEKELSENETLLGITDIKVNKEKRAMSESDFIKNSYVIKREVEQEYA